jgi:hypothetical protein
MNFEVLRLAGSLAVAGAVMLTASTAMAGDWKKGRGHHKHNHYYYYDREVVVVRPPRPVYYAPAPRPVVVYPAPVYAPPVAYAPMDGPVYPRGGNLSIGVNVPLSPVP